MKIKVKTRFDERNKVAFYRDFEIVEKLPEVGDIKELNPEYDGAKTTVREIREAHIDCEQGNDDVYNYTYYCVFKTFEQLNDDNEWEFVEEFTDFIAIEREYYDD